VHHVARLKNLGKYFFSAINADAGGAAIMDIRVKNAQVAKSVSCKGDIFIYQ
jgi:hypothetical protein